MCDAPKDTVGLVTDDDPPNELLEKLEAKKSSSTNAEEFVLELQTVRRKMAL